MKKSLTVLMVGLGVCWLSVPLDAHHSFASEYDATKPVERAGVVAKVEWTNPHMRVYVDVTDDNGVTTTWNLELGSPNSVLRRGWTRSDLKAGDRITFRAYGGKKVLTRAVADSITLADGRAFSGASGAPDR